MDIKTKIDSNALRRWKRKLPCCRDFFDTFFGTCDEQDPIENFMTYLDNILWCCDTVDVFEESRAIVYHRHKLVTAFEEITGLRMNYDMPLEEMI